MGKRYVAGEPESTLVAEARQYRRLVEQGLTHGQVADRYSKDRTHVANLVSLLDALPEPILEYLASPTTAEQQKREGIHELTMSHARCLKGMKGYVAVQMALFERIKADGVSARFCEAALRALRLGLESRLSPESIGRRIQEAPADALTEQQILGEQSALEQDPACATQLQRLRQQLGISARFEGGNLVVQLQDNLALFKEFAALLLGR